MADWSEAAGERLRAEVRRHGHQADLCDEVGTSRTSLNRFFKGADPGAEMVGRLAGALGVAPEYFYDGQKASTRAVVEVPVYDIEVVAGAGRLVDQLTPIFNWVFPKDWLEANLRGLDDLKIFRVAGDSQWPELSDGDLVAIDSKSKRLTEDLHVVRVYDALKIKRIVRDGDFVRLLSRNELYPEETVDLREGDSVFEIIGRVVWASKLL